MWISVWYAVAAGHVLLRGIEFETFNVFLESPRDFNQATHQFISPKLLPISCQLDLTSLEEIDPLANFTSIVIIPTRDCHDYLVPVINFSVISRHLSKLGFSPVSSIIFCEVQHQRLPVASPDSTIYSSTAEFLPLLNMTYHVAPHYSLANLLSNTTGWRGKIINQINPWSLALNSPTQFSWTVAFRVVKFLLVMAQFILCGFVCVRTQFRAKLQIFLLLVGILQLGGDQVLSWMTVNGLTARLYSSVMLLPACIVNSMVVLSWCNIVWRLKTSVIIGPFKLGVVFESMTLCLAILFQLFLVLCSDRWIGLEGSWFALSRLILLITLTSFPTVMGVWFFRIAQNFCPIFHATAKLINAQWFTMFILLTRIFFIINLSSYLLIMLFVESPKKYIAFHTMNDISTIAYNIMIVLTVLKMQAITPIQHQWTPEQLGIATLPDGTVVCLSPDTGDTSPTFSSQPSHTITKFPSAQTHQRLLPSQIPDYST